MPKLKPLPGIPVIRPKDPNPRIFAAKPSRWDASPKYPITKMLGKTMPAKGKPATFNTTQIVSESLCDDMLQRLSPFLQRNAPVDILDLWPGAGILSAKINKLLNPRRHVLVEPEFQRYEPSLGPVLKSRPCYKYVNANPIHLDECAKALFEHFPEQGPSNTDQVGALPRNDTLLVLANIPPARSAKDHITGSRWLAAFAEHALQQTGLHTYGSVRFLGSANPHLEPSLPRTIGGRARPSLAIEQIALHAFEVASSFLPDERATWAYSRRWESLTTAAEYVEQKMSRDNVLVPVDRVIPPVKLALSCPRPSPRKEPVPYEPRAQLPTNAKLIGIIEEFEKLNHKATAKYKKQKKIYQTALTRLATEDRQMHSRTSISSKISQIDEINTSIARHAADPKATIADLEPMVKEAKELRASTEKAMNELHFDITRVVPRLVDDRRAAFHTGSIGDSVIAFDRRPFEPLLIHDDELFPSDGPRTWVYFEADPNPVAMSRLDRLDPEKREVATNFVICLGNCLGTNSLMTVDRLIELTFTRTVHEMVKAVPSLARYATRTPKPDFDNLPKTLHYNKDDLPEGTDPDPVTCYQENLNYDLSDIRCRILPITTIWDLAVEYAREGNSGTVLHLNRILGGTSTSAMTRDSSGTGITFKASSGRFSL